jgi:hypothetical protein
MYYYLILTLSFVFNVNILLVQIIMFVNVTVP